MNHRRHLLDRGRGFKFGETHLSHDGTRGHASRQNYDNICSTKHCFPTDKKQTPRQEDIQRRKQKVRPWWGRRREAIALERGCNGSLFIFLKGALGLGCPLFVLCVPFLSALLFVHCSFRVITSQQAEKHERRLGSSH